MGASQKTDPSNICIDDISKTREDPLARAVRKGLASGENPVHKGIMCVFSTELPQAPIKRSDAADTAPLPGFRSGILPVLGPLPAMFGNALAVIVIEELAGWDTSWPATTRKNDNKSARYHRRLSAKELTHTGR